MPKSERVANAKCLVSNFGEFIGNQNLIERFIRGARDRRMAPVLLFAGPEGVGKKTFALLAAKYLNCASPSEFDCCGRCPACLKIAAGNHPDVRVIEPDGSQIKIEQTRELSSDIQFRPFEAKRKGYIIDQAEKLNEAAANSILKTLEECPPHAWIVLTTDHPNSLLSTIRSRCQLYRFAPVPSDLIEPLLITRGRSPAGASTLARLSGGSIGRALSRDWDQIQSVRNDALEMIEALSHSANFHKVRALWNRIKTEEEVRQSLEQLFDLITVLLRDILLIKEGAGAETVNRDVLPRLEKIAAAFSFNQISGLESQIWGALRELQRNVNPQILIESLYFECKPGSED